MKTKAHHCIFLIGFLVGLSACLSLPSFAHTEADILFIMPSAQELGTVAASTESQSKSYDPKTGIHFFDRRWMATSQSRSVSVSLKLYPTIKAARDAVAAYGANGVQAISIGDGGFWTATTVRPYYMISRSNVVITFFSRYANGSPVGTQDQYLKAMVKRIDGMNPPLLLPGISITTPASGTPNPVGSGSNVTCSVSAKHTGGASLTYQWLETNGAGRFLTDDRPTVTWIAPSNTTGKPVEYELGVTVTAGSDSAGSTFKQIVLSDAPPIEIISGPTGTPTPAESKGKVNCTIKAQQRDGLPLTYRWHAPSGGWVNDALSTTEWQAPAVTNTASSNIVISVDISDGQHVLTSSYTQQVVALPDLVIYLSPTWQAKGSTQHFNTEASANEQIMGILVENRSHAAAANDVTFELGLKPPPAASPIMKDFKIGTIGPRKAACFDIFINSPKPVENQTYYASVASQRTGDEQPSNNVTSVTFDYIYYAHNGTRAFSWIDDTYTFANTGIDEPAMETVIDALCAHSVRHLDIDGHKQKAWELILGAQYNSLLKSQFDVLSQLGSGGLCYGMVASVAEYFRDPSLRPGGVAVPKMQEANIIEPIKAYHSAQVCTVSDLFLTGQRIYEDWGIKKSIDKTKALLKKGDGAIVSLVWKEGTNDCYHAVLGYKIVKVKDQNPVIYIYDPNHPARTTISNPGKPVGMDQLILASDGAFWKARGPMSYVGGTGISRYSNSVSVFPVQKGFPARLIATFRVLAYQSVMTMSKVMFSQNQLGISLQCPADLLITDSKGRQTGIVNGQTVNTIPGAEVITTGLLEDYRLPQDNAYTLAVSGTDTGTANLSLFYPTATNQLGITAFTNLPLTAGCQLNSWLTTNATMGNISNSTGTLISPDLLASFTNQAGTVTVSRTIVPRHPTMPAIPEIRSKANTPFSLTTPTGKHVTLAVGSPPPDSLLAVSCDGKQNFTAWSDGRWMLAGQHGYCPSIFGKGIAVLSASANNENIKWSLRHSLEPGTQINLLFRQLPTADWQTIAHLIAE